MSALSPSGGSEADWWKSACFGMRSRLSTRHAFLGGSQTYHHLSEVLLLGREAKESPKLLSPPPPPHLWYLLFKTLFHTLSDFCLSALNSTSLGWFLQNTLLKTSQLQFWLLVMAISTLQLTWQAVVAVFAAGSACLYLQHHKSTIQPSCVCVHLL